MTTLIKRQLHQPVASRDDLIAYLAGGTRPREQWGLGMEVEKLVVDAESGEAAAFPRIEKLLEGLAQSGDWTPVRENGHLIALLGPNSSVTLEPGGQLELSGRLCPDLHCSARDFHAHVERIVRAGRPLGLMFLGLGVQPFTPMDDIEWLPKHRYDIMRRYMARTGDMGQRMMKQSAGLQVNLDFSDEADCIDKLRTAQLLAPLLYALFANSPLLEGRPSGFLSTRGEIWSRTDGDRCGLIPQLEAEGAGYATYVDYALQVPMYFIFRDEQLLDLTGRRLTFGQYLQDGFEDYRPTLADWDLHLSTLFPEVRLRPQIELRSADTLPPGMAMSVAALAKGLLYDDEGRRCYRQLFHGLDRLERETVYRQSWRLGLRTPVGRHTLREVALEALSLAREGLQRQARCAAQASHDEDFLRPVRVIAESGWSLAERLLQNWPGSRQAQLKTLRAHCGYDAVLAEPPEFPCGNR